VIEDVPLSLAPTLLPSYGTGVSPTRTRRRFPAAYKLKILEAAAQCTKLGDLGALLRREGLYTSHLAAWRAAARRGEVAGLAQRRGPKPTPPDPHVKQIATLERLELIVEPQKQVSQLLGLALPASGEPPESP
jgi:transposase